MKALSVKQPWASLIAHGIKPIENRTWKTNFRGRIYIHASGIIDLFFKGNNLAFTPAQWLDILKVINIEDPAQKSKLFVTSAIIGEVDIIDCVINHPSIWAEQMEYDVCENTGLHILRKGQKKIWNWVLDNAELYEEPILNVKGKLSFWDFEK